MVALGAEAFDLGEQQGAGSVLLLHGLTGSPAEMRPIGEALARAGHRAVCPLLPGHGTTPLELNNVSAVDMRAAAERALQSLGPGRHAVCGLSMGALLALGLAAHHSEIRGIVTMAPPFVPAGRTWGFVNVLGRLRIPKRFGLLLRKGKSVERPGTYLAVPLRWGRELRCLIEQARIDANRITMPALVLHGEKDDAADPRGSRQLMALLPSTTSRLLFFPGAGHVLPLSSEAENVCSEIVRFATEGFLDSKTPIHPHGSS